MGLIFCVKFSHNGSWSTCLSIAQARAKSAPPCRHPLGLRHFLVKSRVMWSCEDPGKFLSQRSLLDPGKVLNRRSCENPGEILSKRPVHEKLADAMS